MVQRVSHFERMFFLLQALVSNFVSVCSMLLVVLMCVERFAALKFPFRYNLHFTMRGTILKISCLAVYSVSIP